MNTLTLAHKRPARSPSKAWRILGLWTLGIGVVLAAAVAWFLTIARSALPQVDGTVPAPGLSAPVSVTRDSHGVPMIEAANLDDLFFAQGYVTAQDRLFQMDLMRRAAAGELSEVVGDVALEHDRQQRILGIRAAAEINLAQTRASQVATAIVNAQLYTAEQQRAHELERLQSPANPPERSEAEDCVRSRRSCRSGSEPGRSRQE